MKDNSQISLRPALADQRDRITNLLRAQAEPVSLPSAIGDISQSLLSALSQNTGAAGFQQAQQNTQQQRESAQAANLQKQTSLYGLMQDAVKSGDQDSMAVDKAIRDIAGNDVAAYEKIAKTIHDSPEQAHQGNAHLLAARAASQMGYRPMSLKSDEADIAYKQAQIAKAYRPEAAAGGGATGAIVSSIMRDNPGMNFTQALQLYQTGFRSGTKINPDTGEVETMPGYLNTREQTKASEAAGKTRGEQQAEAALNLPTTQANADYMVNLLDDIKKDPGLKDVVGVKSGGGIAMNLGVNKAVPGTKAADFMARFDQIKGKQFLEAYNSLKGGGSITEAEGQKATQAISRMNTSQSEPEFLKAVNELQNIVKKGAERAKQRAGMPAQSTSKQRFKFNPQTGQVE
jgi:hypothetical protein